MNQDHKTGFTIVELMLAMAFVSALLVAIAMTVIQIGNIYNKGVTFKGVNQAGVLITNDIKQTISNAKPFNVSGSNSNFVSSAWGGRLCTGQYSYIWNYGAKMNDGNRNKYSSGINEINFVKIFDSSNSYCANTSLKVDPGAAVELINKNQNKLATNNLAMHYFNITSSSSANDNLTGQRLYRVQLTIGTNDQDALTGISGATACRTPNELKSDPYYCAVNSFEFTVRAGNNVE